MHTRFLFLAFSLATSSLALIGCSSSDDDGSGDDGSTGGSSGSSTGGSSGASGSATGGASTGGSATGGASTGGSATGGASTGGSATGGTGGGSPGCESACARVVGAACGPTTQADCVAGCNSLTTTCPDEIGPYNECLSNPANAVTCDTVNMAAQIAGCDDQVRALSVCGICVADPTDVACGTCSRSTCCDELQAYVSAADVDVFDVCVTPCADQACVDACTAASPLAGAAYAAINDCQIDSCGEECVCSASAEDTTCVACLKVGCCAELIPYVAAEDLDGFAACVEPCADQACVDDCVGQFPVAGSAYNTLIDCAGTSCLDECGS